MYSEQDRRLQTRVLSQLTSNMYEFHDIFFRLSTSQRMDVIAQDRAALHERFFKTQVRGRGAGGTEANTLVHRRNRSGFGKILLVPTHFFFGPL